MWIDNSENPLEFLREPAAWFLNGITKITEENPVTFAPGLGLWAHGTNDKLSLHMAGQVLADSLNYPLAGGFTMIGNPFPTQLSLNNIVPQGDTIPGNGDLYIQSLKPDGTVDSLYMWIDNSENPLEFLREPAAWFLNGITKITDENPVFFKPGQGLWLHTTKDAGQSLDFIAE